MAHAGPAGHAEGGATLVVIWEFEAQPDRLADFEAAYAGDGPWAHLFARSSGYLGSQLLRDAERPGRYLTIDRWTSREAFDAFSTRWRAEYAAMDAEYGRLTLRETQIGRFEAL